MNYDIRLYRTRQGKWKARVIEPDHSEWTTQAASTSPASALVLVGARIRLRQKWQELQQQEVSK